MTKIITDLDKLRDASKPISLLKENKDLNKTEIEEICVKLEETLNKHKNVLALTASQIGIDKRIFAIRFQDTIKIFINPIITKKSNYKVIVETFSSMPGKDIVISRPDEITAVYYNRDLKYEENKFLQFAANIFDQQCQIIDGVLPDELGLVSDIEADGKISEASEEEFAEIVQFYHNFIKTKLNIYKDDINTDKELAEQYRKLEFSEDVINGRTQLITNEPNPLDLNRKQRRALKHAQNKDCKKKYYKKEDKEAK